MTSLCRCRTRVDADQNTPGGTEEGLWSGRLVARIRRFRPDVDSEFTLWKRIKANYRDIDSFLHEEIDAEALYRHLLRIAGALNFVHELYLGHMPTCEAIESIIAKLRESASTRPRTRLPSVRNAVAA